MLTVAGQLQCAQFKPLPNRKVVAQQELYQEIENATR
jgi:hypothetical protein